jgi:plasmid maintenance system antidote protein VapI
MVRAQFELVATRGNSREFWLNAQRAVDLWDAARVIKDDVARIKPLRVA